MGRRHRTASLLDSCADHQRHDPEVFLWNARRALEAMCHLLITVHRKKPSRAEKATNETSLDGMIRHLRSEAVLDREQAPRFELARSHTNLGVHIQQPEREDYAAAVQDTAHVLAGLVEWLYDDSIAKPYLRAWDQMPVALIRSGGRDGPSLKDAATLAREEKGRTEKTLARMEREVALRDRALAARETRWWRWLWRVTYGVTLGFSVGVCTGAVAPWEGLLPASLSAAAEGPAPVATASLGAAAPRGQAVAAPAEAAASGAPVAAMEASASLATAAPAPSTSPEGPGDATSCPIGMVLVPGRSQLPLAQPVGGRKNWPRPDRTALDPVDVGGFCIDEGPRTREDVASAGVDTADVARCRQNVPADGPAELVCLTRDEAERICANAVPGGHLAGLLEWESAARAGLAGLTLPSHEWTGERFPPAVLRRFDPAWDRGDGMWVGRLRGWAEISDRAR